MIAPLLPACTGPADTDSAATVPSDSAAPGLPPLPTEQRTLPRTAPAVALMAVLAADDTVTVEGTVHGPLHVDLDSPTDSRDAFRYAVLDADGDRLFERTRTSPVIVRDFLDHYGAESGYDILFLLPQLGRFPLQVPLLDEGATVIFELRQPDGAYVEAGRYALENAEADDLGVSDQVTGWQTLQDSGPSEQRLDVVLLGDGYTADQRDEWHADSTDRARSRAGCDRDPSAGQADVPGATCQPAILPVLVPSRRLLSHSGRLRAPTVALGGAPCPGGARPAEPGDGPIAAGRPHSAPLNAALATLRRPQRTTGAAHHSRDGTQEAPTHRRQRSGARDAAKTPRWAPLSAAPAAFEPAECARGPTLRAPRRSWARSNSPSAPASDPTTVLAWSSTAFPPPSAPRRPGPSVPSAGPPAPARPAMRASALCACTVVTG